MFLKMSICFSISSFSACSMLSFALSEFAYCFISWCKLIVSFCSSICWVKVWFTLCCSARLASICWFVFSKSLSRAFCSSIVYFIWATFAKVFWASLLACSFCSCNYYCSFKPNFSNSSFSCCCWSFAWSSLSCFLYYWLFFITFCASLDIWLRPSSSWLIDSVSWPMRTSF